MRVSELYKFLVRSHLEYDNEICYPLLKRQSAATEKVQRGATKLSPDKHNSFYVSYGEKFLNKKKIKIKISILKHRRMRSDIIQT